MDWMRLKMACFATVLLVASTGCVALTVPHGSAAKFVETPEDHSGTVRASAAVPAQKADNSDSLDIASFGGEGAWSVPTSENYQLSVVQSPGLLQYSGLLHMDPGGTRLGLIHGLGAGFWNFGDSESLATSTLVPVTLEGGVFSATPVGDRSQLFGQVKFNPLFRLADDNDFSPGSSDITYFLTSSVGLAQWTESGVRVDPEVVVRRRIPNDGPGGAWQFALAVTLGADYGSR